MLWIFQRPELKPFWFSFIYYPPNMSMFCCVFGDYCYWIFVKCWNKERTGSPTKDPMISYAKLWQSLAFSCILTSETTGLQQIVPHHDLTDSSEWTHQVSNQEGWYQCEEMVLMRFGERQDRMKRWDSNWNVLCTWMDV